MKILTIVGNRPQFIKLGVTARRLREMGEAAPFRNVVVNTGQHYDEMLSDIFFTELDIEAPAYNLGMGSGHIVDQIGRMMQPLRGVFDAEKPDALLVYGDTNSTIAGAVVAAHLGVPVLHVEGGERLYRRSAMPEETNRVVTDHLSDLCLVSSRKALGYLRREGFGPARLRFVGDPMYDVFKLSGEMLADRDAVRPEHFGLAADGYGLCTIHRAENTDDRDICLGLLQALDDAPSPILLPAHPRLNHRLQTWGWRPKQSLRLIDPLGYFDFQSLLRTSAFIVTDSGGVGREAFFAGKPAIIPLDSSAWIEAAEAGLAVMTGRCGDRLRAALHAPLAGADVGNIIEANFGTGNAGTLIVDETAAYVAARCHVVEGPWHPLGRFDQLPNVGDVSMLSHQNFRTLVAAMRGKGRTGGPLVLDITQSLDGAAILAEIARSANVDFTVFVDVGACAFNPFAIAFRDTLVSISAGANLVTADAATAAALGVWLGCDVGCMAAPPPVADSNGFSAVNVAALDFARDDGVRVQPWLWSEVPVSIFESRQRVADAAGNAIMRSLAADMPEST